jgi:hypothetical protein
MNLDAFKRLRTRIAAEPAEAFNMRFFGVNVTHPCGTAFCLGGHVLMDNGAKFNNIDSELYPGFSIGDEFVVDVEKVASRYLGIFNRDGQALFNARLNLNEWNASKDDILLSLDKMIEDETIYSPQLAAMDFKIALQHKWAGKSEPVWSNNRDLDLTADEIEADA